MVGNPSEYGQMIYSFIHISKSLQHIKSHALRTFAAKCFQTCLKCSSWQCRTWFRSRANKRKLINLLCTASTSARKRPEGSFQDNDEVDEAFSLLSLIHHHYAKFMYGEDFSKFHCSFISITLKKEREVKRRARRWPGKIGIFPTLNKLGKSNNNLKIFSGLSE